MKCLDRGKLTPAIRICAAMSLVIWLAAWGFCSAECLIGDSPCQPSHHEEQAADSHHDHGQTPASDPHDGCKGSFCDSLKTLAQTTDSIAIAKPQFGLAYTLSITSLSPALIISEPEEPVFRQAWRRDWVFTPEVYLGPALRSHAPPLLS